MTGLRGERSEQEALMGGSVLPHEAEMGVLRVEHLDHGFDDALVGCGCAGGCVLPEEIAKLLGRVWVAARRLEDGIDGRRRDLLAGVFELPLDVGAERLW